MVVADGEPLPRPVHEISSSYRRSLEDEPVHLTIDRGDESDPPPPGLSERCVRDSGSGDHGLGLDAVGMEFSGGSRASRGSRGSSGSRGSGCSGGSATPRGSEDGRVSGASGVESSRSEPDVTSPAVGGNRLLFGGKPLRSVALEVKGREAGAEGEGAKTWGSAPVGQSETRV